MDLHRRNKARSAFAAVALLLIATVIPAGCASGIRLRTEAVQAGTREGNFQLYLYGCHYGDDLENLALIVDERSPYRFDLFVADRSYRIIRNLSFDRAVEQADRFLRCGIQTVTEIHMRRILAPGGDAAGYELLPHYVPFEAGAEEAVFVTYSLKNDVITVFISLNPALERKERFLQFPGRTRSD